MSAPYIYEFMYRGRSPGSTEAASFHILLAQETEQFGRSQTAISDAMTPEQAEAAGFPLPTILTSINTQVIADNTDLREQVARVQAAAAAAQAEHEQAAAALQAQIADLQGQVAQLTPAPVDAPVAPESPTAAPDPVV